MPRVRVITPTYNRAELLRQAITSALDQEFTDFELMIVDDGSTDSTPDMLKDVAKRDPRVRFLSTTRLGVARARNAAVAQPGDFQYVAFLDSDDLWLPHHLAQTVPVLDANPDLGAVFARIETLANPAYWTDQQLADRESRMRRPSLYSIDARGPVHLLDSRLFLRALIRSEFQPHVSGSLIRARAVTGPWFDPTLEVLEDTQFFLRLALTHTFAFIDAVHGKVRYHGDNLSGTAALQSAASLTRCSCLVRYARWRLTLCDVPEDRSTVRAQLAESAYLLGQCWAEHGNLGLARRAYLEALAHKRSYPALKGLLASLLPLTLHRWLRRPAHSTTT